MTVSVALDVDDVRLDQVIEFPMKSLSEGPNSLEIHSGQGRSSCLRSDSTGLRQTPPLFRSKMVALRYQHPLNPTVRGPYPRNLLRKPRFERSGSFQRAESDA